MKKILMLLLATHLLVGMVIAQDEDTCYSNAIEELQALIDAEAPLQDIADTAESLALDCDKVSSGEALYSLSANSAVNLRAGAGTNHDVVGKASAGQAFEVFGEIEGDRYTWLEIRFNQEVAYIAKSLTTRLPDVVLEENEDAVELEGIPCAVDQSTRRDSRTTVQVVEYGGSDAEFDVTRLSDNAAMRLLRSDFDAQTDGTYFRYGWQSQGSYILTILHPEGEESVGFQVDGVKTHFLRVRCE
jgi:hypothetical protein